MVDKDRALEIIGSMSGVEKAFFLDRDILEKLREEERNVKAILDITVRNDGFDAVLEREEIICIIKNTRFRPPPEPTVILEGDDGCLMGIEVFPHSRGEYDEREDVIWLSEDFVVFPDVTTMGREFFVMPPVSFPELNPDNGFCDVVSCSPSPTSDKKIKDRYGLEDDPKLASILVGFNGPHS